MTDRDMLDAMRSMLIEERENTRLMIREETSSLREDIAKLNHELVPKVNAIYDGFTGQRDKLPRLDVIEGRVDKLEYDVFALKTKAAES